jgi:hypothetical protein
MYEESKPNYRRIRYVGCYLAVGSSGIGFDSPTTRVAEAENKPYLNACRKLTNDLSDAAFYEHLQDDEHEASETIFDILHISDMLRVNPQKNAFLPQLVAAGIDAVSAFRVMMIASDIHLTADPNDHHSLQMSEARKLIEKLLVQDGPEKFVNQIAAGAPSGRSAKHRCR